MVHQEENKLQWLVTDPVPQQKTADYVYEKDRIICVHDPVFPTGDVFLIDSTPIPGAVGSGKQVPNVDYCMSKFHAKGGAIDMSNHNIINLTNPSDYHHGVNKQYCDANSSKDKDKGTGSILGPVLGGLLGLAGGVAGSAFVGLASDGLMAIGTVSSGLTGLAGAASSVFQTGI